MADSRLEIIIAAKDLTQKTLGSFQARLKAINKSVFSLQGGLVTLAGSAGFGMMVKNSLKVNDALGKTADRLGLTTEALAGLNHAAELTGAGTQTMEMALQRMTRRIAEAANGGGEAVSAIKDLGLSAADLARQSPDQAFSRIADAMKLVTNQSDRVRLAFKLFDSEGVKLLNTLAVGSGGLAGFAREAKQLGIALDRNATASIEAANDATYKMNAALKGIANTVTVELAPHMVEIADTFTDWTKTNRELLQQNIDDYLQDIAGSMATMRDIYNSMPDGVVGAGGVGILAAWLGKSSVIGGIAAGVAYMADAFDDLYDAAVKVNGLDPSKGMLGLFKEGVAGKLDGGGAGVYTGKIGPDTPHIPYIGITPNPDLRVETASMDSHVQMFQGHQAALAGYMRAAAAIGAYEGGQMGATDSFQGMADANKRAMEMIEEQSTNSLDIMKDAWSGWAVQFSSSLADMLLDADASFSDIAKSWGRMLTQMAIQSATTDLFNGLSGSDSGWISSAFSWLRSFAGGKASGGAVYPGQTYLVGERGPELLTMGSGGHVTPNNQLGGATINQTFDLRGADANAVPRLKAAARQIKRETIAEIEQSLARGGRFYRLTR